MTDGFDPRLTQARLQMLQGQSHGAVETLRRVLSEDPEHAEAHALLALCLLALRRLTAAGYEARTALSFEPESPLALSASARVLLAQRKFGEARERVDHLLEVEPDSPSSYRLLADILHFENRDDEAGAALRKALELDPEDPETLVELGDWHRRRGDDAEARRRADDALRQAPEHGGGLVLQGWLLLRDGCIEEARDHAVWALRAGEGRAALGLLTAIKARQNKLMGLWWRWSNWMGTLGGGRILLVLLGSFVLYRVAVIAATQAGNLDLANWLEIVWLLIVAYTWVGPAWFQKSLERELGQVELSEEF